MLSQMRRFHSSSCLSNIYIWNIIHIYIHICIYIHTHTSTPHLLIRSSLDKMLWKTHKWNCWIIWYFYFWGENSILNVYCLRYYLVMHLTTFYLIQQILVFIFSLLILDSLKEEKFLGLIFFFLFLKYNLQ